MGDFWGSEKTVRPEWTQTELQKALEEKLATLLPGAGTAFTTPVPGGGPTYDLAGEQTVDALSALEGGVPAWYSPTFKDLLTTGGTNALPIQRLVNAIKSEIEASQPARMAMAEKMGVPYQEPSQDILSVLPDLLGYAEKGKGLRSMREMAPLALEAARSSVSLPYTAAMTGQLLRQPEAEQWQNLKDIFDRLNPSFKDLTALAGATGAWITPEMFYSPGWGETILPSLIEAAGMVGGAAMGKPPIPKE